MRRYSVAAFGILLGTATLLAQVQPPPAPWRGAGPTPCVGADGGIFQCPPAPRALAVRAGRLFDSKTGQMLTRQVVILQGERISDVGPEAQIKIPTGAEVIDLSQATVLPGLIDAHTHMFNNRPRNGTTEASMLIAVQNAQADLRAGFTLGSLLDPSTRDTLGQADGGRRFVMHAVSARPGQWPDSR